MWRAAMMWPGDDLKKKKHRQRRLAARGHVQVGSRSRAGAIMWRAAMMWSARDVEDGNDVTGSHDVPGEYDVFGSPQGTVTGWAF